MSYAGYAQQCSGYPLLFPAGIRHYQEDNKRIIKRNEEAGRIHFGGLSLVWDLLGNSCFCSIIGAHCSPVRSMRFF